MQVRRPTLALAVLLALLTVAALGALTGSAAATTLDWRASLALGAHETPSQSAADYKRRLAGVAFAQAAPVAADADLRYVDGDRPSGRAAAATIFAHDQSLAVAAQAALNEGSDAAALVPALNNMLLSERRTVESMLADARLVGASGQDATATTQGEGLAAQAKLQWSNGQPVPATQLFQQAVDRAFDVLDSHGIAYSATADADHDGVPDVLELRAGSDPRAPDSDGDGLTDTFEFASAKLIHHPMKPDTDGDGIGDAVEDADGDGLTAFGEQTVGTSPLERDTDGDSLTDGAEVSTYKTNPAKADTDDDGLDDAAELAAHTNPLNPDTDGDGILDGADITTQTANVGDVQVSLTGVGDLVGSLAVKSLADDKLLKNGPGQAGPAYDISLPPATGFQHAQITLAYDPARAGGSESDLRVFWFDEAHGMWKPASDTQSVDTAANTVTTSVEHFSIYAIFNVRNWDAKLTGLAGTCKPRDDGGGGGNVVYVDVAFVLDSSGSMSTNDPSGIRRTAAKRFVDAMLAQDRGAVVDFDSFAVLLQGLTSDKALLKAAIDRIDSSGGTDIGAGVRVGLNALGATIDPTRAKIMILLTDGEGSWDSTLISLAVSRRVTIYTIGLGSSIDETLLRSIASNTGGQFFHALSAEDLPDVFREIGEDTGDNGTDTDGDGLTDCEEETGVLDAAGFLAFTSDPRIPDTDGDGMTDAEEVNLGERFQQGDVRLYPVFSDPRAVDTEGDGLDDLSEADAGSRARSNETDGDGLGDLQELEIGTDPTLVDTDGDGYGDGEEDLNRAGGFDPLATTHVQSTLDYVGDFILGATCGELLAFLCQRDSVAWLAGNVAGGFFVVTDIRDAIGLLFQGDLVGAGLSILSVIPIGGDALGVVAKAVKFIRRVSSHAGEALKVMMKSDLPRFAKLKLLDDIAGAATSRMRSLGVTDDALERLGKAGLDLRVLDEAMQGARAVVRNGDGFVQWRDAERILRETGGGAGKGFSTIRERKGHTGLPLRGRVGRRAP